MPGLAKLLAKEGDRAVSLAQAGEAVRAHYQGGVAWREWPIHRLEALYEVAYLRFFVAWENFLEESFYRYLCGYASRHGQQKPVNGYHATLADAEQAVLGTGQYIAWYNLTTVDKRCKKHFSGCLHETVFSSNSSRLECFSAVRHRIAHGQSDAKTKFDNATLTLFGKVYSASRPGTFLRDWDHAIQPKETWLETITRELVNLANQIA